MERLSEEDDANTGKIDTHALDHTDVSATDPLVEDLEYAWRMAEATGSDVELPLHRFGD